MPYQEIHVPAEKWFDLNKLYCVYHAYDDDDYDDPLIYSFVLSKDDDVDKSHDIREWNGYNDSETVEENIQQAFETGNIYFCPSDNGAIGFTTW